MRGSTLKILFALATIGLLTQSMFAAILLNGGYLLNLNNKDTTAVNDKGQKIQLESEKATYNGFVLGLDVPIMPGSFGVVATIGFGFRTATLGLNQYNIENYEYNMVDKNGKKDQVIRTEGAGPGTLENKNMQSEIVDDLQNNPGNYLTEISDTIMIASVLFRYSFPVKIPFKPRAFKVLSGMLSWANPYIAAGFSNVTITRELVLNDKLRNYMKDGYTTAGATKAGHQVAITCAEADTNKGCGTSEGDQEIIGKDPAPDPDFYFTYGLGFNFAPPMAKFAGKQLVMTLELTFHRSLSPDDQQSPFDDSYIYNQKGMSFRAALGIVL